MAETLEADIIVTQLHWTERLDLLLIQRLPHSMNKPVCDVCLF
jgi:hypothetical protein